MVTHVVFERRGRVEDNVLELEFRRVIAGANFHRRALPFEIVLADKRCNSAGLQLADLIARPVGRHVIDSEQPNRAYDIIRTKFYRSPNGTISGYGLKIFP